VLDLVALSYLSQMRIELIERSKGRLPLEKLSTPAEDEGFNKDNQSTCNKGAGCETQNHLSANH
jgi:hypothetical protein